MDKSSWKLDLEETKQKGSGLGLRSWDLDKKSYLKGVVIPWTQKTLESNTPPLKNNGAGVYAVTDLDRFISSGSITRGPLRVYGIVRWGGKWQYHGRENVVRANKATIVHLWVSDRLARADGEIPVFLSSYYRVPVDTYTDAEDLRNKILDSLFSYESEPPKGFSNIDDWLKFQDERKATTHKDPTGPYGSRDTKGALLEDIRVFNLKDKHLKNRDEYHSSGLFPDESVYLYKIILDQPNSKGLLSFLGAYSIKKAMEVVNSTKESCYLLLSRHKIGSKFLSIPISIESLSLLPSEALYKVESSGKVTRVKNFMQDFEVMRVAFFEGGGESEVNVKEVLDVLKDEADSTVRNSEVLRVLDPSNSSSNSRTVSENLRPFLSKKSTKWIDQTWEGSDLNKRLLVFGFLLANTTGNSRGLVASSPDYLSEAELDKYTVDYDTGVITGPSGSESISSARQALRDWKNNKGYIIGLEEYLD